MRVTQAGGDVFMTTLSQYFIYRQVSSVPVQLDTKVLSTLDAAWRVTHGRLCHLLSGLRTDYQPLHSVAVWLQLGQPCVPPFKSDVDLFHPLGLSLRFSPPSHSFHVA